MGREEIMQHVDYFMAVGDVAEAFRSLQLCRRLNGACPDEDTLKQDLFQDETDTDLIVFATSLPTPTGSLQEVRWASNDDLFSIAAVFLHSTGGSMSNWHAVYSHLLSEEAANGGRKPSPTPPPLTIPPALELNFTMGGAAHIALQYIDEASPASYRPYSRREINRFVALASLRFENYYGATDRFLYAALRAVGGLRGRSVAVLGSLVPWYEAVCVASSAASCVTIEYNPLSYDHPRLKTVTVEEWRAIESSTPPPQFDAALSISSFEHDGLGRYGDPIAPNGDLAAMASTRRLLKEGGLLFLAVPCGPDAVVWNAHRIYGAARLPLLLGGGWELVHVEGFDSVRFDSIQFPAQPVFVLRKVERDAPLRSEAAERLFVQREG